MWLLFVFIYIVLAVTFTQYYKIVTRTSKSDGNLTVLLQLIAGISVMIFSPLFKFTLPGDYRVYIFLGIACIFYAISDRLNTTVRFGIEASAFSIIKQVSTVFMILAGLLFFKEPFVLTKIIGASLIIFSNILIFYKKGVHLNKYFWLGILANLAFSFALFIDVNLSINFNLPFYVALTLIIPALIIFIFERLRISNIKKEIIYGNKKAILITGLCWGTMLMVLLKAYQIGEVTTVAPLCALTVITNVIVSYIFLKERSNLLKKIIAALLIIISVILIKL
jgi:drug/metabolite transporter (DMT)-like permease